MGGGGDRRPNVVVFVVWSSLIVGGWVMVTWDCSRRQNLFLTL